ncbi:polyserase-2-like [Anopheles nili]|uniref:polyserase-2-like n=1 Tax=Anopheles nili TaxID=185578 RepID=UPI00237AA871|nr:polyserase-2-like [Anopheles nili]
MGHERYPALTALKLLLVLALCVVPGFASSCGERKVVTFLILDGEEAKDGFWPWHVALFHNEGRTFRYECGGTILDQNTVLTAAHCVMTSRGKIARERLVVQVGRNRLYTFDNRAQEHEAFELIVHPEYRVNEVQHDMALIKLATDITYTNYIQPICLWNRGEDQNSIVGSYGTVIGFGYDESNAPTTTLRETSIPVVSTIACIESNRDTYGSVLTSNMFCAGTRQSRGACNGDSGGGLFFQYDNIWYVRGVVSFTKELGNLRVCDPKEYTVFTDVAKYLSWIEQYLRKKGPGGGTGSSTLDTDPRLALLPLDTCGPNPYASRDESLKPILAGYPWTGLIEYIEEGSRERKTRCQATLISDLYLITAAHCVTGLPKRYSLAAVRLGDYNQATTTDCSLVDEQTMCTPPVQVLRIESVITHNAFNKPRFANDIALVRLRDRADTSRSNVKPICLPVTNELRSEKPAKYMQTAWTFGGNVLERSFRDRVDSIECQKQYVNKSVSLEKTSRQICIRQQEPPGDGVACKFPLSAAPLQLVQSVQGRKRYVLHGVLSYGPKSCTVLYPDVYANVASYLDWILSNIQE